MNPSRRRRAKRAIVQADKPKAVADKPVLEENPYRWSAPSQAAYLRLIDFLAVHMPHARLVIAG